MQESQDKEKKVAELIDKKFKDAEALEQTSIALKATEGKLILARIKHYLDITKVSLQSLAMQPLGAKEHYEYSKDDLQKMKILRGQIDYGHELLDRILSAQLLEDQCKKLRKEAFDLSQNPNSLSAELVY